MPDPAPPPQWSTMTPAEKIVHGMKFQADLFAIIGRFYPDWQTDPKQFAGAQRVLNKLRDDLGPRPEQAVTGENTH